MFNSFCTDFFTMTDFLDPGSGIKRGDLSLIERTLKILNFTNPSLNSPNNVGSDVTLQPFHGGTDLQVKLSNVYTPCSINEGARET